MTRRQWMKAYSEALQHRGLWFRKEANRAAEIAVQDFYHHQPERVAMVTDPPQKQIQNEPSLSESVSVIRHIGLMDRDEG